MNILTATDQSITVVTGSAVTTDYVVSWADNTSSTFTPGSGQGNISTATTTTVIAAPGASTQRAIKGLVLTNRHASSSQTVQVFKTVGASSYAMSQNLTLLAGQTAVLSETGLAILTSSQLFVASGKLLQAQNSLNLIGTDSTTQTFPTTNAVIARTDAAQTFTGNQTYSGRVLVDDVTDATTTTDGSLQTDGGLSVAKKGYFGGAVKIADTTASTSTTTGALVVAGGVGIGGAVNAVQFNNEYLTTNQASISVNKCLSRQTSTTNGTYYTIVSSLGDTSSSTEISAGVTNSGYVMQQAIYCRRSSATDHGALGGLYGQRIDIGHNNSQSASSTTTAIYGTLYRPFLGPGTITGMSVMSIDQPLYSTGTCTTMNALLIGNQKTAATTNSYAINIANQSAGGYTIKTGTGIHEFGDDVSLASGKSIKGKHKSDDGTAGMSDTRTFYTASSSGGTVNVLNTVTIKDGLVVSWVQA